MQYTACERPRCLQDLSRTKSLEVWELACLYFSVNGCPLLRKEN